MHAKDMLESRTSFRQAKIFRKQTFKSTDSFEEMII